VVNFGRSIGGIPSRGGPPALIVPSGTLCRAKSVRQPAGSNATAPTTLALEEAGEPPLAVAPPQPAAATASNTAASSQPGLVRRARGRLMLIPS